MVKNKSSIFVDIAKFTKERERDCFIFIEQTNETYFINCLQIGLVRHVDSSGLDLFFEKANFKTQYNQERDTSFKKKKKNKTRKTQFKKSLLFQNQSFFSLLDSVCR